MIANKIPDTRDKRIAQQLVDVRLYGHLRRFGRSYRLAVSSPKEAVRALCCVLPGFEAHIWAHNMPGYHVIVDKSPIDQSEFSFPTGRQTIKIVPVIRGASKNALGTVFVGAMLIGLSLEFPGFGAFAGTSVSSIAMNIGVSMALFTYSGPLP